MSPHSRNDKQTNERKRRRRREQKIHNNNSSYIACYMCYIQTQSNTHTHRKLNETNNDNNKLYFLSFTRFTCEILKFVLACCCYGYCWNDVVLCLTYFVFVVVVASRNEMTIWLFFYLFFTPTCLFHLHTHTQKKTPFIPFVSSSLSLFSLYSHAHLIHNSHHQHHHKMFCLLFTVCVRICSILICVYCT